MLAPVVLLIVARSNPKVFWIGLPFVIVGQGIRLWSAGYLCKMSTVISAGPFALCRNPLYIGSFIMCIGYLIMCHQVWAWIIGIPAFWAFHGGAIVHEEEMLREKFGEDFTAYCKKVPRLLPIPRSIAGNGKFSMKQLIQNNEYKGLTGTAVTAGMFAIIAYHPELFGFLR